MTTVSMTVNGKPVSADIEDRTLLVYFLRENLRLTGTHIGCDTSQCGACMVHVDGRAVKSCSMFAVQAEGAQVTTIEGLGGAHPVQQAWLAEQVTMCGYCEPGFIMAIAAMLDANPAPSSEQIGALPNICRCGAYPRIRQAIARAAASAKPVPQPKQSFSQPSADEEQLPSQQ